ncbi:MAG: circularly permuted type 2 ATP-grasp protein [Limisphaerales bacterium]
MKPDSSQRATLLNKILADCYGAQELIRSRWLSPALVFGQPDFLRPCHGIRVPGDNFLHFYAADLGRSPDGRWWVVSDRTQIPTGAGYALANRLVTSRILPEPFRDNQVHRLAGFFPRLAKLTGATGTASGGKSARRHAYARPA